MLKIQRLERTECIDRNLEYRIARIRERNRPVIRPAPNWSRGTRSPVKGEATTRVKLGSLDARIRLTGIKGSLISIAERSGRCFTSDCLSFFSLPYGRRSRVPSCSRRWRMSTTRNCAPGLSAPSVRSTAMMPTGTACNNARERPPSGPNAICAQKAIMRRAVPERAVAQLSCADASINTTLRRTRSRRENKHLFIVSRSLSIVPKSQHAKPSVSHRVNRPRHRREHMVRVIMLGDEEPSTNVSCRLASVYFEEMRCEEKASESSSLWDV